MKAANPHLSEEQKTVTSLGAITRDSRPALSLLASEALHARLPPECGCLPKTCPLLRLDESLLRECAQQRAAPSSFALKGRGLRFEHLTLDEVVSPLIWAAGLLLGRFNPSPQNRFLIGR